MVKAKNKQLVRFSPRIVEDIIRFPQNFEIHQKQSIRKHEKLALVRIQPHRTARHNKERKTFIWKEG